MTDVVGMLIESRGPAVALGDFCEIESASGRSIRTQVAGFRDGRVLSIPLEETDGLQLGATVVARVGGQPGRRSDRSCSAECSTALAGRWTTVPGFKPASSTIFTPRRPIRLSREPITKPLVTGIRVIDSMLPCGQGQRVGMFGGSGVGKSTLLGAMSRQNSADVTVIAIDRRAQPRGPRVSRERTRSGRTEALRCRCGDVGPSGALARARLLRGACDCGISSATRAPRCLLVMDSVTRLAMAQREIGLAAGEPPSQKGYTPSVFNLLPKVFERAGNFAGGSITGFFTVLVEGDDFNEPICDAVRGILDGHIVLSRELGASGHYPAIDVLQSVSRVISHVAKADQIRAAQKIRESLACYQRSSDLFQLGAYVSGSNPKLDASIRCRDELISFLRQDSHERAAAEQTLERMLAIASNL